MAPLMPGAYLHAFLALPRGLAAANAAATIYCVDGGKTPCALPVPPGSLALLSSARMMSSTFTTLSGFVDFSWLTFLLQ